MQKFEKDYAKMLQQILQYGEDRAVRNGGTRALFGMSLPVEVGNIFPLIQGRQMFIDGILGEFAAMIRQPKSIYDFEKWGCNYWRLWGNEQGDLNIDYGNAWFDFNGFNQIAELKRLLRDDPTNRRMIISSWQPDRLAELSLPCCHYSYQFYVGNNNSLNMLWTQRSVDMMIGLPSDIVLAAIWLITLANEFGFKPGFIKLDLGDCHIYDEHLEQAEGYVDSILNPARTVSYYPVNYHLVMAQGTDFCTFEPAYLKLSDYHHGPKLQLLLKE